MSWVLAVSVGISHIVQVVSMLEVIIRLGETVFQSRDVNGAVCSGVFEFDSKAKGVSLLAGTSRWLDERVMEFPGEGAGVSDGRLQSLR